MTQRFANVVGSAERVTIRLRRLPRGNTHCRKLQISSQLQKEKYVLWSEFSNVIREAVFAIRNDSKRTHEPFAAMRLCEQFGPCGDVEHDGSQLQVVVQESRVVVIPIGNVLYSLDHSMFTRDIYHSRRQCIHPPTHHLHTHKLN